MTDLARLDRILSSLPPDDAAYLSGLVEPAWKQRARRLALRDDAIRRALLILEGEPSPAARLAELMARQVGQRWEITGDHLVVEAVARILNLNDGVSLRERQVRNIAKGERSCGG